MPEARKLFSAFFVAFEIIDHFLSHRKFLSSYHENYGGNGRSHCALGAFGV